MKNYKDSDYAVNKFSKGIVYRFVDKTVEITLEVFLTENPGKTERDFRRLKRLSNLYYYRQDRQSNAQTKKDLSLDELEKTIPSDAVPMDVRYEEKQDQKKKAQLVERFFQNGKLPEIQKRRFLMHYRDGLNIRQIAKMEGTKQNAVWKSIEAVKRNFCSFVHKDGLSI